LSFPLPARFALAACAALLAMCSLAAAKSLDWQQLPPLPDREGFAGPFAGVHSGALIIAGGANFPDLKPWEGGTKIWYDSAFILAPGAKTWTTGQKLPRPLGYGVSLTTPDGVACLGGSDSTAHYADCFLLRFENNELTSSPLPRLPRSCANFSGALLGKTIYVAGGIETPDAGTALHTFWSLDLSASDPKWQELEPWPGPPRMFATAGAQAGSFYLFGGASLAPGSDGKPVRTPLRDAYRFTPGRGWKQIADLPRPPPPPPTPPPTHRQ
jgi:N-acetylneuraminate epimerase